MAKVRYRRNTSGQQNSLWIQLTWELDLKKNILLALAAVPSCTNTGVDEPPVPDLYSLKMYLPLNSLHDHTATATQDWADRTLLPYASSHVMALHRTTSERELRAIEGMRSVAAVTQRGWGIYESPAPHTKYVPATCEQKAPTSTSAAYRTRSCAMSTATVPKPSAPCLQKPPASSCGSTSDSALCRRRRAPAVRPQDQSTYAGWSSACRMGVHGTVTPSEVRSRSVPSQLFVHVHKQQRVGEVADVDVLARVGADVEQLRVAELVHDQLQLAAPDCRHMPAEKRVHVH